jgi:hypothetical protein
LTVDAFRKEKQMNVGASFTMKISQCGFNNGYDRRVLGLLSIAQSNLAPSYLTMIEHFKFCLVSLFYNLLKMAAPLSVNFNVNKAVIFISPRLDATIYAVSAKLNK